MAIGFPHPAKRPLLPTILAFAISSTAIAHGQVIGPPPPQLPAQTAKPVPARLEIKLAPSRDQLTAGGALGIIGTLTNTSTDSAIYLTQQSITLMEPPELVASGELWTWPAYFPSEIQTDDSSRFLPADKVMLALRPGQSMTIGWSTSSSQQPSTESPTLLGGFIVRITPATIRNEMRFIFFTPGRYQIAVQAKYWTNPARPPLVYSTATQTVSVQVLAPQFVILFGAALGGLIAFLVFQLRDEVNVATQWVRVPSKTAKALLAMLWSAVTTILLSRLAEAQLPIRVTVADFWGAITIGLVAQYLGAKWLDRLLPRSASNGANAGGPAPAGPQPPPAPQGP